MDFLEFCKTINTAFTGFTKDNALPSESKFFLKQVNLLAENKGINVALNSTQLTVLFEGYYRYVNEPSLKQALGVVRQTRWKQHFGIPTITFLLSYKKYIDLTAEFFGKLSFREQKTSYPWLIQAEKDSELDKQNSVLCNPKSIAHVEVPIPQEITGRFTKTYNPFGGFTTSPCDPVSQKFIKEAEISAKNGRAVLEVGAGFGAATLEALNKGAIVFCNDISPENLAVVRNRFMQRHGEKIHSITGDCCKLILVPGEFPNELRSLPEKYFDAILICRVLHFFPGVKIEQSLAMLANLLAPGGKLYIVCETPYLKNWEKFLPVFNQRSKENQEWPGEISNPSDYESSGRKQSLPKFVHWITKEILERSLQRSGLKIDYSEYINRAGQFPDDLLLPEYGQESVGAIGMKL
ncbi:class I SAM-dependent methyltransferase [Legionella septentrionalis]|uniref:class I SAM-dependent methyltransferase n=1 Tax=Legionella septentrionalis TaxID=2498109 RepID=UPI000F8EABF0|nr:class I SAM-dependent methyltransferase [Legionella septentrionalis]RUR09707.1 class I SAM-dependent methyltransferase [Legionella septentrionalis]